MPKKDRSASAKVEKRNLFRELMSGVKAMREHREGRLTLRTQEVTRDSYRHLS